MMAASQALSKLDEIGMGADNLVTDYHGRSSTLEEAYRTFAEEMLEALTLPKRNPPDSFVLGNTERE